MADMQCNYVGAFLDNVHWESDRYPVHVLYYWLILRVLYFTNFRKIIKLKPRKIYSLLLHNQVNVFPITTCFNAYNASMMMLCACLGVLSGINIYTSLM